MNRISKTLSPVEGLFLAVLFAAGCLDYQLGAADQDEAATDFDNTSEDEEYESSGEGIEAHGCDDIVLTDADGDQYEVGSYLTFELDSPYEEVTTSHDFPNVLVVATTARCGDVVLEAANFFMAGEDRNGSGWLDRINETASVIMYGDEDQMVRDEWFGRPYCGEQTLVGVTEHGLWWPLEFSEPALIEEGQTIYLTLAVWFWDESGFVPASEDRFQAELDGRASWYGLDDPAAYPDELLVDRVVGAPMRFVPVEE